MKRDVALKVLPDALGGNPDRVARFEREAHALASLNHPHIATLYGMEEIEGRHLLAMELVEGPTLAEWIAGAGGSVDERLAIAIQIAEALEAAHERGIVHRDLKPANIKLTGDPPTVKVLDFGLAKALAPGVPDDRGTVTLANSPTLTNQAMTQAGIVLGTAAYMSPEQAKGLPTDHRTDIFAFGCVLFELLTGRAAFDGDSAAELIELARRCLAKSRRERYQAIGDVRAELEHIRKAPPPPLTTTRRGPVALPWSIAAVMTFAALAAAIWPRIGLPPADSASVTRFEIQMPADHERFRGGGGEPAFTPDGRTLVYVGVSEKGRALYSRRFDQLASVLIHGTEGAGSHPQVSPDGSTLAFYRGTNLQRVEVGGGTPVNVATDGSRGITWLGNDMLAYAGGVGRGGVSRVPDKGGVPVALVALDDAAAVAIYPQALPGRDVLAYTVWSGSLDTAKVAVRSLATGEDRVLLDGTNPRLTASGHLVFARGSAIWAVPFDNVGLQTVGEPVRVVEDVQVNSGGLALFAISPGGTLAYVPGSIGLQRSLVWVDRSGRETPINAQSREYLAPRVSPDGTRVAVTGREPSRSEDIWILDIARSVASRLTSDPARDFSPVWTQDGRQIVFGSARTGASLLRRQADGARPEEVLIQDDGIRRPQSFASRETLVIEETVGGSTRLVATSLSSGRKEILLEQATLRNAVVSRDGSWLAYQSTESGQSEIYVRPFPRVSDQRWQLSTDGGVEPLWSPQGDELFYRSLDGQLLSVPVRVGPSFVAGEARLLIEARYPVGTSVDGRIYDVSPDGRRFLMVKEGGGKIVVVENWFTELNRLVPPRP